MSKRYFLVDTGRYGGEVCVGTMPEDFVSFWNPRISDDGDSDFISHVQGIEWDDPDEQDSDSPSAGEEFYSWTEADDIEHLNGPYADSQFYVQEIQLHEDAEFTEYGSVEWREGVDHDYTVAKWQDVGEELGPFDYQCLYSREAYANYNEPQEDVETVPVMTWHSGEKGCFGQLFIETDGEDFNDELLHCGAVETDCTSIIERYWYNKQELDICWDWADTTGKGYYAWVGFMNPKWHDKQPDDAMIQEYFEDWE
jgi:hypothetical protein